ncbi:hypothetical protein CAL26_18895 [Bordetella genomosp. 9]|uniref:NEL domain-containing protein n=1 Tax=Bordetella genomosp. 9 TaxID=1416803 RepID=A0A261R3S7_9BORD|nr:NEL-type E3 ubiquitin ligase domain-containing protein [Bordetella genomosp. 9]OZI19666.1 hypothetical protein CAL26_18895 [Bordetella genomosp. 9]
MVCETAHAFAQVRAAAAAAEPAGAPALTLADAWKLLAACLPVASPTMPTWPDIAVPPQIAGDARQRIAYRTGVAAARELGLDTREFDAETLMELGRQTVADHMLSGTADDILIAVAGLEGKIDGAAWASGDPDRIAAQVEAYLRSEFQDEIDLYQVLDALAAEPPLLGRQALAATLLREQGIDPGAPVGELHMHARHSVSASSPPLLRQYKAADYYFNYDKLSAEDIRGMRTRSGGRPTDEQAARMLRALPASLDAEFQQRYDAHRERTGALLGQWLSTRLRLHAREHGIELAGATVAVSRAAKRYFLPGVGGGMAQFSDAYGSVVSQGFLVAMQAGGRSHRCFVSTRTGAVHVLPAAQSSEDWLADHRELAFDDADARARLSGGAGRWLPRVHVREAASGPLDAMRDWAATMFRAEIELGRESARGQTVSEQTIDALLDQIPFRAMVVALRKGDIPTAIVQGSLDVLTLLPQIGMGFRLAGAAVRSARPWLSLAARFGGIGVRQGWSGVQRMAGQLPLLRERLRTHIGRAAMQGLGRVRPLDVTRIAQAMRATAPRLADILERMAVRTRGTAIPNGVWQLTTARAPGGAAAAAQAADTIAPLPSVAARNLQGGTLGLLPYGTRGSYTQVDAAGRRTGALLVADSEGWLYQTLPLASLARYRVASPRLRHVLDSRRAGPEGVVTVDGLAYARLDTDYVRVVQDPGASTATRPIWRAVAPAGVAPDMIAHRLVYDRVERLWHQAAPPGLAGGGASSSRSGARGRGRIAAADVSLLPDDAQLARLRQAMVAGIRNGTPQQAELVAVLFDRIVGDRRGRAILNALSACHDWLGRTPEIVLLPDPAIPGAVRPALDRPETGRTWYLDLQALRYGNTQSVVHELAAVYNNMTGLLQNQDPFDGLLAEAWPPINARLEKAWANWLAMDPMSPVDLILDGELDTAAPTPRRLTVRHLRLQLREMACYGGLDRSTMKAVLRNQHGRLDTKLNLSHRNLDSIPPLPRDISVLNVSNNLINDWRNLPVGLTVLDAEATGMHKLPDNLPAGLKELNVTNNRLAQAPLVLPPGLTRLGLTGNRLVVAPALPAGLKELLIAQNELSSLPAELPAGLELLDASSNALVRLPDSLPAGLRVLHVSHNRLERLPVLPDGLTELDVGWNSLDALPDLPTQLRVLEAASNRLESLPASLPRDLEMLIVPRNRLQRLPDALPRRLTLLTAQYNAIELLPGNIVDLASCTIHLDGNPLAPGTIPIIAVGNAGPRIFFNPAEGQPMARRRTLAEVTRVWWSDPSQEAGTRWDAIDRALGPRDDVVEFAGFLDKLRMTISFRDPGFRAQVEDWLIELSKLERRALLDDTLLVCNGATQTCEDRITVAWNDMQKLRRNDDIRRGLYDDRVHEAVDIAREMFRIDVLTEFASRQERGRPMPDPVELYLAYLVRLREPLDLTTVAPMMRFYELSLVTAHDLVKARETVQARERAEFDMFLVLDYEPWQTLLKRKDAAGYARAQADAERRLAEQFDGLLREAVDGLGLDPADASLLDNARANLGPGIMRRIRYEAMRPLTEHYLSRPL